VVLPRHGRHGRVGVERRRSSAAVLDHVRRIVVGQAAEVQ
jgi:hypothetical protein